MNDKNSISQGDQIKLKWEGLQRSPRPMTAIQIRQTFCTATSVHKLTMRGHVYTITQEIVHETAQYADIICYCLFSSISFFLNAGYDFFILFHDPSMSHKTVCKALNQHQHRLFQADKTKVPEIFSRTHQSWIRNPRESL